MISCDNLTGGKCIFVFTLEKINFVYNIQRKNMSKLKKHNLHRLLATVFFFFIKHPNLRDVSDKGAGRVAYTKSVESKTKIFYIQFKR